MHTIVAFTAGALATVVMYWLLPAPFVWIFVAWFAVCLAASLRGTSTWRRIVCANAAAALFVLTAGEVYFAFAVRPAASRTVAAPVARPDDSAFARAVPSPVAPGEVQVRYLPEHGPYVRRDDVLGYAPSRDAVVRSVRHEGPHRVYDVTYTIGADGLRATPAAGSGVDECILFFGGSFTFGEGVEDAESMPWLVGESTGARYRVYNFGFHGYGPHQMLSALEHGMVDRVVDCRPKYVFYQAIRAHLKRVANVRSAPHELHNPRYRLLRNGDVVYDGHFDDPGGLPEALVVGRSKLPGPFMRSYLFAELHWFLFDVADQIDLLVAIVDRSRRTVERRWPGSEFHVILWNESIQTKALRLERALVKRKLRVHRVSDMLPGYFADKHRYHISEIDSHPNARAHALIAGHVAREIITPSPTAVATAP